MQGLLIGWLVGWGPLVGLVGEFSGDLRNQNIDFSNQDFWLRD